MKTVCCVCRKTKGSKGWNGRQVKHFKKVVFGVCPPCYSETLTKIKENYNSTPMDYGLMVPCSAEI